MAIAHDSLWHISDFMDYNTLINARQTCRLWSQAIPVTKLKNTSHWKQCDFVQRFCNILGNSSDFITDLAVVQSGFQDSIELALVNPLTKRFGSCDIYQHYPELHVTSLFWMQIEKDMSNEFKKNYGFFRDIILKMWKDTKDDPAWWRILEDDTCYYLFNKSFIALAKSLK